MKAITTRASVPSLRPLFSLLAGVLVFMLLLAGPLRTAGADDNAASMDPGDAVSHMAVKAIEVLVDPALDGAGRRNHFRVLLNQSFDMDTIGRFVLGRYWPRATTEEQQQFRLLFEDFLITSYVNKLETYSGESLEVTSARRTEDEKALVGSRLLLPSGEPIRVEWHMRQDDRGWRIVDVVIEGVSLAVTIRSEFNSVMSARGGVAGLIERLRQVTANAG